MTETILIVDDQPDLRSILRQVLEAEDYHCLEASDGEMAFQVLNDHPLVDLVVIDIKMPRMNGLELLASMRTHPVFKGISTIVITAQHSDDLRIRALEAGAGQVLFKPFDLQEFKGCVHRLLTSLHTS